MPDEGPDLERLQEVIDEITGQPATLAEQHSLLHQKCDDLTEQLRLAAEATQTLQQTLADLRVEHAATERRLFLVVQELRDFKVQVVRVAAEYGDRHDLCEQGLGEALEELGLELPPRNYQGTLTITVQFRARLNEHRELPDEEWVKASLYENRLREAIRGNFQMDDAHDRSSVDSVEIEVSDVSELRND